MTRDSSRAGDLESLAATLGRALAHRGPDGCGSWRSVDGAVLLVHRRLAIIDPTEDGAQPMATGNDRRHLVFNGEVYNFRELRRDLQSRGEQFRTSSDTEVLLRLVTLDGPQALARVRGMFALACWDTAERCLLLARDRFGIKPLYVAAQGAQLAFASELGALRAAGLVDARPSAAGVAAYLTWGSVPPPLTWMRGAEMLPAGTWREWRQDGAERRGAFADLRDLYRSDAASQAGLAGGPAPAEPPVPAWAGQPAPQRQRAWRDEVGHAVRDSMRAHLVADVPVGVFLSGGIDSGAIVSAAVSAGAGDLQTFTVGLDDRSSETARARQVAAMFGTRHHDLQVDPSQVVTDLLDIVARIDQPTIDGINSFYVSRAVASTGIKAVLSGAGGDELFGGYATFARLPKALAAKRLAGPAWPLVAAAGRAVMPERLRARWRHFAGSNGQIIEAYRVQRGFLMPDELALLAGPALREPHVWDEAIGEVHRMESGLLEASGPETLYASVARLESRLYLQSQLLRDIDVMAMAHGLEVRVPFVDHRLVSVVWPELGRHPSLLSGKRLLHSTLERPLPTDIVGHPKQGFTLPFARWMHHDLAPLVQDGMRHLAKAGWIADAGPGRVWSDWQSGRVHWSRPWGLGILGHFLTQT